MIGPFCGNGRDSDFTAAAEALQIQQASGASLPGTRHPAPRQSVHSPGRCGCSGSPDWNSATLGGEVPFLPFKARMRAGTGMLD